MLRHYQAVYLSPHLDDVALSCGGQIFSQTRSGDSVLIVTITAGDSISGTIPSLAQALHRLWQIDADAACVRRNEDVLACATLGADYWHWGLEDSIYRRHPETGVPLYISEKDICGPIHAHESDMVLVLAQQMEQLPGLNQVFAPLGLGNHIDHQLTRLAAETRFGKSLRYYEDYIPSRLSEHPSSGPIEMDQWNPSVFSLSPQDVEAKIAAVAEYQSQIRYLFGSRDRMARRIEDQVRSLGGERTWIRP